MPTGSAPINSASNIAVQRSGRLALLALRPLTAAFGERNRDSRSMVVNICDAEGADQDFLERMFVDAALWDPDMKRQSLDGLLRVPQLRRYFIDWGRPSDVALIAKVGERSVGAAWYRFFLAEEPGYGFVEESIPELGIAVLLEWRGRCLGTRLLGALINTARTRGCSGLSLSVAATNPARRLYERHGFVKVGEAGSSWTMLARLS